MLSGSDTAGKTERERKHQEARERNAYRLSTARASRARKPKRPPAYVVARRTYQDPEAFGLRFNLRKTHREAKQLKHIFYFTGHACRRGHYAPRYTWNRHCTACAGDKRFPLIVK